MSRQLFEKLSHCEQAIDALTKRVEALEAEREQAKPQRETLTLKKAG